MRYAEEVFATAYYYFVSHRQAISLHNLTQGELYGSNDYKQLKHDDNFDW
jgi:hypothetical protein